jgi:putative endonuclease
MTVCGVIPEFRGSEISGTQKEACQETCRKRTIAQMRDHVYFVYILASSRNGTLYVGVTNELVRRVQEHREGLVPGFTRKYAVKLLVYWELHHDINEAILREKRIKRWQRKWKLELIETSNPQWRDLWPELIEQ